MSTAKDFNYPADAFEPNKCAGATNSHGFSLRRPCKNNATRDGYCGIHHPNAKRKARKAINQFEAADRTQVAEDVFDQKRIAMFYELREALRDTIDWLPDELVPKARKTLTKADRLARRTPAVGKLKKR